MQRYLDKFRKKRLQSHYESIVMLIQVFFGQDCDEFGETIEEVVESYGFYNGNSGIDSLRTQITEMLNTEDKGELVAHMELLAENQFDPEVWGETWRSFLLRVLAALE